MPQADPVQTYQEPEYVPQPDSAQTYDEPEYVPQPDPVPAVEVKPAAQVSKNPPMVIFEPTDAEKLLKEETDRAKKELLDQIKGFRPEDEVMQRMEQSEQEDPRVAKFKVTDPVEVGGAVRYTIEGEDDEGPFKAQRRFREFHALNYMLK